jgi:ubiquinone/menaquinone biosynthesis C-methylase UbiE
MEKRKVQQITRKPFEGVLNIIRFNWHFYALALLAFIFLGGILFFVPGSFTLIPLLSLILIGVPIFTSLAASFWVYDCSNLYQIPWIASLSINPEANLLVVNAGFDEFSPILKQRFPKANIQTADFYDPKKHTEVSIKRARKIFPPAAENVAIETHQLPFEDDQFDFVFIIFAAHEIRDDIERHKFFEELNRVCSKNILVTEHLRDGYNFLAYTLGFTHFLPLETWKQTFQKANLKLKDKIKTTPFVNTFILENK